MARRRSELTRSTNAFVRGREAPPSATPAAPAIHVARLASWPPVTTPIPPATPPLIATRRMRSHSAIDRPARCLTDVRISCEIPPPPSDDAPELPPPAAYHARRSTRWLVSCIRLLGSDYPMNEKHRTNA